MTPSQSRLWQALGLGPRWVRRTNAAAAPTEAAAAPVARLAPPADASDHSAVATASWDELRTLVAACRRCGLCETRTQTVFGVGSPDAHWLVVGEAPGAEEDARGEPFVGQAGHLLDNILEAAGVARGAGGERGAYIANVLKCRPPANRNPQPPEIAQCEPYLRRQIELLRPRRILALGRFAAQSLLRTEATVGSLRGRAHTIEAGGRAVPVVVSYHPAYLLRTLADKSKAWADLCLARGVAADD